MDGFHTYFVGKEGIWVHNCGPKRQGASKNDPHGDGGHESGKRQNQLEELKKQMEGATKKERQRLKDKMRRIKKDMDRKRKAETHSRRHKK